MNSKLHRVVFNKKRGQLMAVAETAGAQGKTASGESRAGSRAGQPARAFPALHPLACCIAVALGALLLAQPVAHAQLIADPTAPGTQRATVLAAPNGVPLVNIQTPSAAGVSRNTWSQFDVQRNGAILNNSRSNVQTQLGGFVQGNPWLAAGSAKVILNEVNSSSPSLLKGYIEVAGQKADVIIANPSGIKADGGGFINAGNVVLTTGVPILGAAGNLESYRVRQGSVVIEGLGLDTRTASSTQILARAAEINAGLWASYLNLTLGANDISATDPAAITAQPGTGVRPAFALDVAAVGGMYAGHIRLIGTEAGLGFNNTGAFSAAEGELVLSASGMLINSGSIRAAGSAQIAAAGVNNTGSIYASGNLSLTSQGAITSSGLVAALGNTSVQAIGAGASHNFAPGSVTAAGLTPGGAVVPGGELNLTAEGTIAIHGQALSGGGLAVTGSRLDLAFGQLSAANLRITATSGDIDAGGAQLAASQRLQADTTQTLRTEGASVIADQLALTARDLSNTGGHIGQTGVQPAAISLTGALDNAGGLIAANGNLTLGAASINNTGGTVASLQGNLTITTSGQTVNDGGTLQAALDVSLSSAGLSNTQAGGKSASITGRNVSIDTQSHALDNRQGAISSQSTLSIDTGHLNNTGGLLEAFDVTVRASGITNNTGAIRAGNDASVSSSGFLNNTAGLLSAERSITISDTAAGPARTLAVTNTGGIAIAGVSSTLQAASLSGDGQWLSKGSLSINLTTDFTNSDTLIAAGDASITTTATLTNSGKLQAGGTLAVAAGNLLNSATGEISATTTRLAATDTLTNRGLIDGSDTRLDAATLNNLGTGRIFGDHVSIQATTLNNLAEAGAAPVIAARERLDIAVGTLNNRDHALIFSAGDLVIGGALDASRQATGIAQAVNNASATIQALGDLSITAQTLANTNEHFSATLQAGATVRVVQHAEVGSTVRYDASEVMLCDATGCRPGNDIAWLGQHDSRMLMLPSAEFPFAAFAAYYASFPAHSGDIYDPTCNDATGACGSTIPGKWYAAADPIWAAFGVTPPAPAPALAPSNGCSLVGPGCALGDTTYITNAGDTTYNNSLPHPVTQAELDEWRTWSAWHEAFAQAHAALDTRLTAFNDSATSRKRQAWNYWDYSSTATTPVLATTDPALIASGGKLNLAILSSATNSMSQIVAGGALAVNGVAVNNAGAPIEGHETQTGVQVHTYKTSCNNCLDDDRAHDSAPYNIDIPTRVTVALGIVQANTAQTPPGQGAGALTLPDGAGFNPAATTAAAAGLRAPSIIQVNAGNASAGGGIPVIRTVAFNGNLIAGNSLYIASPNPSSGYFIETDPRFASYRQWLSSDYMLNALGIKPTDTAKRLGDGFIEQQIVREQVGVLTGHRFLADYTSDEQQYAALMNAGVTQASQLNLRPGIALTAQQMAQLTSDIVWLVEQDVTLADGRTVRALVPQVYAAIRDGDLATGGALLAGDSVKIDTRDLVRIAIKGDAPIGPRIDTGGGTSGDITNTGTILGRKLVSLTAENVHNLAGRIQGDAVDINASTDINNIGGQITAATSLAAKAGRDLNVQSTLQSAASATGNGALSRTVIDRVAGLYVTGANGTLIASAGRDANIIAAVISNSGKDGKTEITAGNNLNLGTLTTSAADSATWTGGNRRAESSTAQIGSVILGAGSVTLKAGNDINATAATVQAGGALIAKAVGDINLNAGKTTQDLDEAHRYVDKKLFSTTTTTTQDRVSQTGSTATRLSGASIDLTAGRDIKAEGASLTAEGDLTMDAGRHLLLGTSKSTSEESHSSQTVKKSNGLGQLMGALTIVVPPVGAAFLTKSQAEQASQQTSTQFTGTKLSGASITTRSGGDTLGQGVVIIADGDIDMRATGNMKLGAAVTTETSNSQSASRKSGFIGTLLQPAIGTLKQSEETTDTRTTNIRSTVASLGGNITMKAGETFTQGAIQVTALGQAAGTGNVVIEGKHVAEEIVYDTQTGSQHDKMSKTAIGGSVSIPLLEAAKALRNIAEAASDTGDARTLALGAATLAMQSKGIADSASALANAGAGNLTKAAGIRASVSLGSTKSESTSSHTSSTAVGSLISGNNVTIKATGAGLDSDLVATGATITARGTVTLEADGKVVMQAAQNKAEQHSTSTSSGANIGIGFAVGGSQNGFTLDFGANKSRGNTDGTDKTWSNTHITGNTVIVNSGGDTVMKGAVITANTVGGKIEGNLVMESLQDESTYKSKQRSAGFGVSLCIPPFCVGDPGLASASVSAGSSDITSTYKSVNEQTGIRAGDGGFQIDVKGKTDLKGAAVTSTQKAIDDGKNRFTSAGGITTSDIQNTASYEADAFSISAGVGNGTGGKGADGKGTDVKGNALPGGSFGFGSDSGSATSVTKAAISGIAGDTAARTGDSETGIKPIFDANKVQKEIDAQVKITAEFGKQAPQAWASYAKTQQEAAIKRGDIEEAQKWAEGGAYRIAGHVLLGALAGGASGAAGAFTSAAVMPEIGNLIDATDLPAAVKQGLGMVASATLGSIVGGTAGAGMAFNVDTNNRQLHKTERSGSVCLNSIPRFISGLRAGCQRYRVVHGGGRRLRRTGRRGGQLGAHQGFHLTRPASVLANRRSTSHRA